MNNPEEFGERKRARKLLDELNELYQMVYDRSYQSIILLNDHLNRGIAGLFRFSDGSIFGELNDSMISAPVDETLREIQQFQDIAIQELLCLTSQLDRQRSGQRKIKFES